ncbi:MAG: ABC transporter ATP-binding protein [Candidatus Woesearchaeota archaeon]|nr:ABC transporter ATP-binding protein [Candidatus Woesearchaeota archaeon]
MDTPGKKSDSVATPMPVSMLQSLGLPIIKLENVSKRFSTHTVLNNITLSVYKGEIFGIIGVSGAGKTTLLELLIGFLKPDDGTIRLHMGGLLGDANESENYASLQEHPNVAKSLFGFATQKPSFYDDLTVRENLDYFGEMYGIRDAVLQRNIQTVLDLVGLTQQEHAFSGELSGGMQKRLDIACALVHNPKILILDEPTADLDIILRKHFWELVRRINRNGTTIILASHFLDEIENLCSRIAVLHNQQIVREGSVDELKKLYAKNQELHLVVKSRDYRTLIAYLQQQSRFSVTRMTREGQQLVIHSPQAEELLHHVIHVVEKNNDQVMDIFLNKPNLNEVFELITKNAFNEQ